MEMASGSFSAVPCEDVWQLLLGGLLQPLELSTICKLLCCSREMAELVHKACEGAWSHRGLQGDV